MRQEQFSPWLTGFADQGCKVAQASYLEDLKKLIEKRSDKKYATIQDAITDFCTRLNLQLPDMKLVQAGFVGGEAFNTVMAALGLKAFNTEQIDALVRQGTPAEAIANEFGNTEDEKRAIVEYVEGRADKQRDENSQIARDMRLTDDMIKPINPAVPRMSSIRSLSTKVAQTNLPEAGSGFGADGGQGLFDYCGAAGLSPAEAEEVFKLQPKTEKEMIETVEAILKKREQLKNAVEYVLLEREKGEIGPETIGIIAQHYGVTEEALNNALKAQILDPLVLIYSNGTFKFDGKDYSEEEEFEVLLDKIMLSGAVDRTEAARIAKDAVKLGSCEF